MAIINCSLKSNSVGGSFLFNSMGGPYYFFQLLPEIKGKEKNINDDIQIIFIAMKPEL